MIQMRAILALALLCCAWAGAAAAATLLVQPGDDLAQALRSAVDGDTVHLVGGDHRGQVAVILHKRLTLRGVPGAAGPRPVLHADGRHAEGKAILVVRDGDIVIDNIEFRGARVPDGNGAGIRFEKGELKVLRCSFIDNQNGILTSNVATAVLRVEDSRFADAPVDASLPHLLYAGRIARLEVSGSSFSGGRRGHLLKSRAAQNVIKGNRLVDGPGGEASYELEFPNGGMAWVEDNVIGQSAGTHNATIVSFGAEGEPPGSQPPRTHGLFMTGNTLINAAPSPARFVRVHTLATPVSQRYANNRSVGPGSGAPPQ